MGLLGAGSVAELKKRGSDLIKQREGSGRDCRGARGSKAGII